MADLYCRNCGQELRQNDSFCPQCGKPVHETAQVPTPETNVPVPPAPQQQASEAQSGGRRGRPLLVGCLAIIALVVLLGFLSLLGTGGDEIGGNTSGQEAPEEPGAGETFTRENYAELVANPDAHEGAQVEIAGQLLDTPEQQGDQIAFQMWADPANVDWNTVVFVDDMGLSFNSDDYVRVTGTVAGSMEGENAFGGSVSAVEIEADSVVAVDPVEAVSPTQQELPVNETVSDQGFAITIKRIEFAEDSTRVHVNIRNDTGAPADFYAFDSQIIQGSQQIDQETPFEYEVQEPQSTISPGVETEGVVVFGPR